MKFRHLINFGQERLTTVAARACMNKLVTWRLPPPLPLAPDAMPLLEELNARGAVYLPRLASPDVFDNLLRALQTRACFDPWRPECGTFPVSQVPPGSNNARIENVAQVAEAVALANHPLVLGIVSHYLGCKPTIDDIVAWWSMPNVPAPKEEQFFHRDMDAVHFVKLFVYLSEVGEKDGAHYFVDRSHRDNRLIRRRRRFSDDEVAAAFDKTSWRCMTGRFGDAFLEDTFGLHKGTIPTRHPRLVFQVRYTSYPSNFAANDPAYVVGQPYDSYINRYVS
ncbi:MAG: hypothetical protein D6782_11195 [Alphaproteobacteria bacterium]|nr:MAG: hypothetical protein D6782_11195 [Alphaproteobacteria bacterium]